MIIEEEKQYHDIVQQKRKKRMDLLFHSSANEKNKAYEKDKYAFIVPEANEKRYFDHEGIWLAQLSNLYGQVAEFIEENVTDMKKIFGNSEYLEIFSNVAYTNETDMSQFYAMDKDQL